MSFSNSVPTCLTAGEIADRLGEPVPRVIYAGRSRNIKPRGRVGILFFYDESQISEFRAALKSLRVNSKNPPKQKSR